MHASTSFSSVAPARRARVWLSVAGLLVATLTSGAGEVPAPTTGEPAATVPWATTRDETFREVWQTVNDSYFDPTFGGVDWAAVRDRYRTQLESAGDKEALRGLLQRMLGELRRSHFAILPRELSVFTPQERSRIGTSGVEVAYVAGEVAVRSVESDSPGAAAGLKPGDVVVKLDSYDLAPLVARWREVETNPARIGGYLAGWIGERLRGAVGSTLALRVRGPDSAERDVAVTFADFRGEWSEPVGSFPSLPVVVRSECPDSGLAYLRFNIFARQAMKDIRALLRRVPAGGGLIIDLRGNGGGLSVMASGISGWLSDRTYPLGTMHLRDGQLGFTVTPQAGAFLGPVAVLVDCGSASTSEIMAAGLQEAGRARIFGERTPGAALPSLFKTLPTGDLLQYAIADVQTPRGRLIEGSGVEPDEAVAVTLADLVAGRDPVRQAAEAWLDSNRRRPAGAPAAAP